MRKGGKTSNSRYYYGGYQFTPHFIEQWRKRICHERTDVIARKAIKRLKQSKLIKIDKGGERRHHRGDIIVMSGCGKTFVTIMHSKTKHKVKRTLDEARAKLNQGGRRHEGKEDSIGTCAGSGV